MSNSKGIKERRSSSRIKISGTGKTQTKRDTTEESDASREDKNNNLHKEESRENMQQVTTIPVKNNQMRKRPKRRKQNLLALSNKKNVTRKNVSSAKSGAAMQEEENKNTKSVITVMKSPKQKMNHSLQSVNKESLQSRKNRPRKTGETNPECDFTVEENLDVMNDFGTAVFNEKQLLSSPSQSAKDGRVINSPKQSPAWKVYGITAKRPVCASKSPQKVTGNTNKELTNTKISLRNSPKNSSQFKEQQKEDENGKSFPASGSQTIKLLPTSEAANKSSCSTEAFEFRDNGSSITSDDDIDSLKKRLFFSPRRSLKKTNTQGRLEDNQSENGHQEQQHVQRKRSLRNWAGNNDNVQKYNLRKNSLENNAPKNDSVTKKTAVHLVREGTNYTKKYTKRSTRASACLDSESDTAVGVEMAPSPPKRVLRHANKQRQKKSEALNGKVFSKEQAFNLSKQVGNKRNRRENRISKFDERSWSEEEVQRLNE